MREVIQIAVVKPSGSGKNWLARRLEAELGEATTIKLDNFYCGFSSLQPEQRAGRAVIIDLSGLTFADSSGVGLMFRLQKDCRARNLELRYRGPVDAVRNVLRSTQLKARLLQEAKP